jgi:hypothetical protein
LIPSRAFFPGKSQKNNPVGVNHSCEFLDTLVDYLFK